MTLPNVTSYTATTTFGIEGSVRLGLTSPANSPCGGSRTEKLSGSVRAGIALYLGVNLGRVSIAHAMCIARRELKNIKASRRRLDIFDVDFEYKITGFSSMGAVASARNALTVSPANEFVFRNLLSQQIVAQNEGYAVSSITVGTRPVTIVLRRRTVCFCPHLAFIFHSRKGDMIMMCGFIHPYFVLGT